jgi:hypothetical protein
MTESTFMEEDERSSPPELASGPFLLKCKDAPANAVIRMKRTHLLHTCLKGWYREFEPRPLPGMGFFVFFRSSFN